MAKENKPKREEGVELAHRLGNDFLRSMIEKKIDMNVIQCCLGATWIGVLKHIGWTREEFLDCCLELTKHWENMEYVRMD